MLKLIHLLTSPPAGPGRQPGWRSRKTDIAAMSCIDPERRFQDRDNYIWARDAEKNSLVVGTQARILYRHAAGRMEIALKFNDLVRKGEIGPVMIGRDHRDTGGTDSPFR